MRPIFLSLALAILMPNAHAVKDKWLIGQTENLIVYSNASTARTRSAIEDLLNVQQTLTLLFPNLAEKKNKQIRVFICKNMSTIKRFSSLYNGKPTEIGGMFTKDAEGDIILISTDGEFEQTRSTVYHEYVHFLTATRKFYMPPWLNEGIAETFSTIEFSKKGAKVGLGEPWRAQTLRDNKLIPFERFFQVTRSSPEYNSSKHGRGVFYAQSWALIHYLLYGKHDLPKEIFNKLLILNARNQSIDEPTFQEISGIGFDELEKRINRYVMSGKYTYRTYNLPSASETDIALAEASVGEAHLIQGILLLKMRGNTVAYPHLARAYEALPESPIAAAYQGYYAHKQEQYEEAAAYFKEAIERGSTTASTYLYHATAFMRNKNPNADMSGTFYSKEETVEILTSLFKARELGENRDKLYHRIGEAWIGSILEPQEGHIQAVIEGLRLYPNDIYIEYCLGILFLKIGKYEDARQIAEHALADPKVGKYAFNFKRLLQAIKNKNPK